MNRNRRQAGHERRGIAMVVVLSMVVLVSLAVALAITVANQDGRNVAKQIHNVSMQSVIEGALQQARSFFSQNQKIWDTYLAVPNPPDKNTVLGAQLWATVPTGYSCYMYARDDADELPPAANNPYHDNNHIIFIGAVCTGPGNTSSELSAVLVFDDSTAGTAYTSQGSGGTQGLNNYYAKTNVVVR